MHHLVHGGKVQQGRKGDAGVEDFVVPKQVRQRVGAAQCVDHRLRWRGATGARASECSRWVGR